MASDELIEAALRFAARGWAVMPAWGTKGLPDGRRVCWCKDGAECERGAGKHAVQKDWHKIEYRTGPDIYGLFDGHDQYNLAIRTGDVSGVFALDVDPDKGGWASLEALRAEGLVTETYMHRTQSTGLHLVYLLPEGMEVPNSSGRLGPGIDVRGHNGYIIAPPSVAYRGAYEFVDADAVVNPPPPGLVALLGKMAEEKRLGIEIEAAGADPTFDMAVMPQRLLSILEEVTEKGRRSEVIHNFVGQAMRAGYTQGQVVAAVTPWCQATGKFCENGVNRVAQGVAYSWGSILAERKRLEIPMPDWWSYEAMQAARPGQPPPSEPSPALPPVVDAYLRVREGHSLATIDWAQLYKADFTPQWLVPNLFEAGRQYSLYGGPGTGKSLLMFDFCCQLASGRMEVDGVAVPPTPVAYFDRENSPADIQLRAKALGYEAEDLENLYYFMFPDVPLNVREGAGEFVRHVVEVGAKMAIVDTLARFTEGVKENESEWVTDVFNFAMVPLKERGITFVRIDHTGQDETRGARGTSAKKGDVDGAWLISLDEKTQIIDLIREKTRTGLGPDHVQFQRTREPTSHTLRWAGASGDSGPQKASNKPEPEPGVAATDVPWIVYDGELRPVLQPLSVACLGVVQIMDELFGANAALSRRKAEPPLRKAGFRGRATTVQRACNWRNARIDAYWARNHPPEPPKEPLGEPPLGNHSGTTFGNDDL